MRKKCHRALVALIKKVLLYYLKISSRIWNCNVSMTVVKNFTRSISQKLVRELRRLKLSLAVRTLAETGFPLTWGRGEFTFSLSFSASSSDFSDLDKSDLDNIFDSTNVLNVLKRFCPFSPCPTDFLRIVADMLELLLTLLASEDGRSFPRLFRFPSWLAEASDVLVEATILGMGNDRLRFRRGGSVVIPHVMPFSLGLIKKVVIYTVFKRWKRILN